MDDFLVLRPFSINVRFARAGEAFIVFDARHARVSRFSKPAPPRGQSDCNGNPPKPALS
jgi:hypothetical protein